MNLASSLIIFSSAFGYICNVAFNSILTHRVTYQLYGDFSCTWRAISLLAALMTYLMLLSSVQSSTPTLRNKINRHLVNFRLVAYHFLVFIIIYYVIFGALHFLLFRDYLSDRLLYLVLCVHFFAPVLSLCFILNTYIQVHGYFNLQKFMESTVQHGVKLVVTLLCLAAFAPKSVFDMTFIIGTILLTLLLVHAIIYRILMWHLHGTGWVDSIHITGQIKNSIRESDGWLQISGTVITSNLIMAIAQSSGVFILAVFSNIPHSVGLFNICLLLVGLPALIIHSLQRHLTVPISNLPISRQETRRLQASLDRSAVMRFSIMIISVFVGYLFGDDFIRFFGFPLLDYRSILPLMTLNVFLYHAAYFQVTYLMTHHYRAACLSIQIVWLAIMIFLGIILVHEYDIFGLVVAEVVASLVRRFLLTMLCLRVAPIRLNLLY